MCVHRDGAKSASVILVRAAWQTDRPLAAAAALCRQSTGTRRRKRRRRKRRRSSWRHLCLPGLLQRNWVWLGHCDDYTSSSSSILALAAAASFMRLSVCLSVCQSVFWFGLFVCLSAVSLLTLLLLRVRVLFFGENCRKSLLNGGGGGWLAGRQKDRTTLDLLLHVASILCYIHTHTHTQT